MLRRVLRRSWWNTISPSRCTASLPREKTPGARAEYERWRRFEEHWLSRYDAVWTMSEDDCARPYRPEPAGAHPRSGEWRRYRSLPARRGATGAPEVFYVGSFRHLPNILGFERLRHEIMPRVWNKIPDARLRVVSGPDPERYWREFSSATILPWIRGSKFTRSWRTCGRSTPKPRWW